MSYYTASPPESSQKELHCRHNTTIRSWLETQRYWVRVPAAWVGYLAPAVTVGETEGAMDSTSGFFWPLLLPITL